MREFYWSSWYRSTSLTSSSRYSPFRYTRKVSTSPASKPSLMALMSSTEVTARPLHYVMTSPARMPCFSAYDPAVTLWTYTPGTRPLAAARCWSMEEPRMPRVG